MTAGKRIALNVAATYGRSLVSLGLGLFSCRWVLQALGTSDFGLGSVVGSLLVFAVFLGTILQTSVVRHFAFAIGRGGDEEVLDWFAAAIVVHFALAITLAVLVWPLGEWLVRHFLVIPEDRLSASIVFLRFSVVSLLTGTICIPFVALFTAYQRFVMLALFGSLQTLFVFICSYGLLHYRGDRLVAYGAYLCAGSVLTQLLQIVVALRQFKGWRGLRVDAEKVKGILAFAGWNLFGGGGWLVASRGSDFVTNRFFGPSGNAAYGIAMQVQGQTEALANALVGAFSPAVTERHGAGDLKGSLRLASASSFLGAVLLAFFAVPLVLEMDEVLRLWLAHPPQGAGEACAILLVVPALNKLTMGQQLAIAADGRIAAWQVVGGVAQMLALPLAAALAFFGVGLRSAALAYAIVFSGCFVSNLHFGRTIAGLSVREWLRNAAAPFVAVTCCAVLAAGLPRLWMESGFLRIVLTASASSAVFAIGIWIWKKST